MGRFGCGKDQNGGEFMEKRLMDENSVGLVL